MEAAAAYLAYLVLILCSGLGRPCHPLVQWARPRDVGGVREYGSARGSTGISRRRQAGGCRQPVVLSPLQPRLCCLAAAALAPPAPLTMPLACLVFLLGLLSLLSLLAVVRADCGWQLDANDCICMNSTNGQLLDVETSVCCRNVWQQSSTNVGALLLSGCATPRASSANYPDMCRQRRWHAADIQGLLQVAQGDKPGWALPLTWGACTRSRRLRAIDESHKSIVYDKRTAANAATTTNALQNTPKNYHLPRALHWMQLA